MLLTGQKSFIIQQKKNRHPQNTVPVLFLLFSAWLIACVGMVGIYKKENVIGGPDGLLRPV